jgi:WD40 repeat protein
MLKTRVSAQSNRFVTCTAVSRNLRLVATGAGSHGERYEHKLDTRVEIFGTDTGQPVCMLECDEEVCSLDFSRDGTMLVTGSGQGTMKAWLLGSGDGPILLRTFSCLFDSFLRVFDPLFVVQFSNDGQKILNVSKIDMRVRIWSMQTGELLLAFNGHVDGVQFASWSPDDKCIASVGYDYTVRVWDAVKGTQLMKPLRDQCGRGHRNSPATDINYHPACIAFGTRTPMLVSAGFGVVTIWDLREEGQATVRYVLPNQTEGAGTMSLCPNDRYIASWGGYINFAVRVWDVVTGQQIRLLVGHPEQPTHVAWSPDSQSLVSTDFDGMACVWGMQEEVCGHVVAHDQLLCVSLYACVPVCSYTYLYISMKSHVLEIRCFSHALTHACTCT